MVFYECEDCKKTFNKKYDYEMHRNRKNKCSLEKRLQNELQIFICNNCGNKFSRYCNLKRHQESFCKKKEENNNYSILTPVENYLKNNTNDPTNVHLTEPQIKKIIDVISDTNKTTIIGDNSNNNINSHNKVNNTLNNLNANINNNNMNNITQNNNVFILSPFGKEGRINVPKKLLHYLYRNLEDGIPKLVEYIHYNSELPQYQNIRGKGYNNKLVTVYDGENWVLENKNDALEQMIKDKKEIFDDFFDDLVDKNHSKLNKRIIEKYNTQSDKLDSVLNSNFHNSEPEKDARNLYKNVSNKINLLMENQNIKNKNQQPPPLIQNQPAIQTKLITKG
jgi:hypothetical protein